MKDMEREKFEQSWKDALDEAAVSPSEAVWTNIELELEKTRGGELKKRVFFYKMLAAASVIFAMAIGGAGYYMMNITARPSGTLASQNDSPAATPGSGPSATSDPSMPTAIDDPALIADAHPARPENENTIPGNPSPALRSDKDAKRARPTAEPHVINAPLKESDELVAQIAEGTLTGDEVDQQRVFAAELPRTISARALPPLYSRREIALVLPAEREKETVDPVVAMLARLEQREREIRGTEDAEEEKAESGENLWTSIGFAAGSFNSIASAAPGGGAAGSRAAMTFAAPIVDQETKASGYSYSMGINVGTRLSDKWVFQGGVNYLTQATEYTADNVVVSASAFQQRFHPATTNELIKSNALDLSNKIVYTAPYNVSNSMRYISIPMQAGYMLVDKTFGLQLNAGVATDLFLQNTIEANSAQIDKTTQGSGEDSPYRTVNLSGLFGTEVSYRFNENYRISLNPGLRYPFNTIYKSALGVESTPLTFDIGLRFRYIFH